jgi:hypothetical protein
MSAIYVFNPSILTTNIYIKKTQHTLTLNGPFEYILIDWCLTPTLAILWHEQILFNNVDTYP